MKKHIPNFCTSMNLFSGCVASVMAFSGEYLWVVVFVLLGTIFDFFDGFLARKLNAMSPIGKELDSLADMVSFGVAPSLIVFHYISTSVAGESSFFFAVRDFLPYFAFLLAIFSGLRLAKFNVDTRQTSSFMGLNTPANALFWISLCYGLNQKLVVNDLVVSIMLATIVIFSYLMVSELPMFSFKLKNLKFKGNEGPFLLILFAIVAVSVGCILGIAATILFYILLALILRPKPEKVK